MSGAHVYRYTFPGLIMVTKNSCHYIFFLLDIFLKFYGMCARPWDAGDTN